MKMSSNSIRLLWSSWSSCRSKSVLFKACVLCNPLKEGTNCCQLFTTLVESFPGVLQDNGRRNLYEELRRYETWKPPHQVEPYSNHDEESGVKTSTKVTVDQYWHKVSQLMLDGEPEFPLLSKLCVAMLSIPYCNAESEQIILRLSLWLRTNSVLEWLVIH